MCSTLEGGFGKTLELSILFQFSTLSIITRYNLASAIRPSGGHGIRIFGLSEYSDVQIRFLMEFLFLSIELFGFIDWLFK